MVMLPQPKREPLSFVQKQANRRRKAKRDARKGKPVNHIHQMREELGSRAYQMERRMKMDGSILFGSTFFAILFGSSDKVEVTALVEEWRIFRQRVGCSIEGQQELFEAMAKEYLDNNLREDSRLLRFFSQLDSLSSAVLVELREEACRVEREQLKGRKPRLCLWKKSIPVDVVTLKGHLWSADRLSRYEG